MIDSLPGELSVYGAVEDGRNHQKDGVQVGKVVEEPFEPEGFGVIEVHAEVGWVDISLDGSKV